MQFLNDLPVRACRSPGERRIGALGFTGRRV